MNWKSEHCDIDTVVKATALLTLSTAAFSAMGAVIGFTIGSGRDGTHTPHGLEDAGFGALAGGLAGFLLGTVACCALLIVARRSSSEERSPLFASNPTGWFSQLSNRVRECFVREEKEVEPYPTTGL